jgi:hypothetical protein
MSLALAGVDRAVRKLDAWRRPPLAEPTERGAYKEWFHFCVRLPGAPSGHLLVNLNLTERSLPSGRVRTARVIALAHTDDWEGHVEAVTDDEVVGAAGQVDLRFGATSLALSRGVFELRLRAGKLRADLRLRPLVLPTGASNVSFGNGYGMQWVAVPRLEASGTVTLGERRICLDRALAYHDHNWGSFRWGADLAWDWGFVHPSDACNPWDVVFVRVSDGSCHRTISQGVIVWRGDRYLQAFHDHEVSFDAKGTHVGPRPLTLPGVMGLLVPGAASGVPAQLRVRAAALGDEISIDYAPASKARVVVPSDVNGFRTVLLNETQGSARVSGRIGNASIAYQGNAIVEFVRG